MCGIELEPWDKEYANYYCVKQSTFPFDRFVKDDIILGPKMRSTGETFGVDRDKDHAIMKSYLGNYPKLDQVGKILVSLSSVHKPVLLPYLKSLHRMGYQFYATSGSANFIRKQGIPCSQVAKINEDGDNIVSIMKDVDFKMVFNTPLNKGSSKSDGEYIRNTAISYGIPCFTREENIRAVIEALLGVDESGLRPVGMQEVQH
jgi:carbamoyl-phosphate synthase large subunit